MSRNGYSYVHGNPVKWTDPRLRHVLLDFPEYNSHAERDLFNIMVSEFEVSPNQVEVIGISNWMQGVCDDCRNFFGGENVNLEVAYPPVNVDPIDPWRAFFFESSGNE